MLYDDRAQRTIISMWAAAWSSAVDGQAARVLPVGLETAAYQTDVYLFILAVREVLRCAEWAKDHVDGQRDGDRSRNLNSAVAAFDAAVPGATDVRDILTHFDEYERGKGTLQKKGLARSAPGLVANQLFERDGETTKLHLLGYTVDVATARDAASTLAGAVITALADDDLPPLG